MDALDKPVFKRFNRAQRAEFAKQKAEEELRSTLGDEKKVRKMASKFEQEIARQRQAAGLR